MQLANIKKRQKSTKMRHLTYTHTFRAPPATARACTPAHTHHPLRHEGSGAPTPTHACSRADTPHLSRHPGIRPVALTTLTRVHLKTFILPFSFVFGVIFFFLVGFFFFFPLRFRELRNRLGGVALGLTSLFPLAGPLAHFRLAYFRKPRRHFLSQWCGGGGGERTHKPIMPPCRREGEREGKEVGVKKKNPRSGELWVVKMDHVNTLPYRLLTQRLERTWRAG